MQRVTVVGCRGVCCRLASVGTGLTGLTTEAAASATAVQSALSTIATSIDGFVKAGELCADHLTSTFTDYDQLKEKVHVVCTVCVPVPCSCCWSF